MTPENTIRKVTPHTNRDIVELSFLIDNALKQKDMHLALSKRAKEKGRLDVRRNMTMTALKWHREWQRLTKDSVHP